MTGIRAAAAAFLALLGGCNRLQPAVATAPVHFDPTPPQKPAFRPKKSASEQLLALTMWAEARGGGLLGMSAVGHVVMNRAKGGKTVREVVLEPRQFSCWSPSSPARRSMHDIGKLPADAPDRHLFGQALRLAHGLLYGHSFDPTHGATYFHALRAHPAWLGSVRRVAVIAGHAFYRPIEEKTRNA